jgi:D-lactate dehydratase
VLLFLFVSCYLTLYCCSDKLTLILSFAYFTQTYSETKGHNFTLNASFDEITASEYDGLVIPGGRAPEYLAMDSKVLNLVRNFSDAKKPIASVCHGQLILAAARVVENRTCTAYPAVKPVLVAAGAKWEEPDTMAKCTVDGNLITAATYESHPEFISLFVKALGGSVAGSDKKILFLCGVCIEKNTCS